MTAMRIECSSQSLPRSTVLDTRISLRARGCLAWLMANSQLEVDIESFAALTRNSTSMSNNE